MDPLSYVRITHLHSAFLVRIKLKLLVRDDDLYGIVRKGHTHLCIEGYPRSANTFAYHLFVRANPQEREHVAHHTHSMANIARAMRYRVPVLVLIRDPVEAVLSAHIKNAFDMGNLDFLIDYYLAFYQWLRPRKDQAVMADFDLVTRDFNQVIERVNARFGVAFKTAADLEADKQYVVEYLRSPQYYQGIIPTHSVSSHSNVPSVEREGKKKQLRSLVEQHKDIGRARALYEEMIS